MEIREPREVVCHQRDVGGFESRVRAGSTHRDGHISGRQRGRVDDAVTDHRARPVGFTQLFDGYHLLVGHETTVHVLDTPLVGDRAGGAVVVSVSHRAQSTNSPASLDHAARGGPCFAGRRP